MGVYACCRHHLEELVVVGDPRVNLLSQLRVKTEERDFLELTIRSTALSQGLRLTNLNDRKESNDAIEWPLCS